MPLRLRGARFILVRRWAAAKTAALRRSSNVWPKYGGSADGADPIRSLARHLGPRARGGRVPRGSLGAAINRSKLARQRRSPFRNGMLRGLPSVAPLACFAANATNMTRPATEPAFFKDSRAAFCTLGSKAGPERPRDLTGRHRDLPKARTSRTI